MAEVALTLITGNEGEGVKGDRFLDDNSLRLRECNTATQHVEKVNER